MKSFPVAYNLYNQQDARQEKFNSIVTGIELKEMAGLLRDSDLFLINQGSRDILIGNDEKIDLSHPGVEHFTSQVKVREHCHSYNYFSPYDILYNNVYIHHL